MKKLMIFFAFLFAVVPYLAGCESRHDTNPTKPHIAPYGTLIGHSDCKSSLESSDSGGVKKSKGGAEDCMEYNYKADTLKIKHINAGFNCCPEEILVSTEVHSDTLLIIESEAASLCHCLCLFDLDIAVYNLPASQYTIVVKELYLADGDDPLVFDVDLTSSPSGKYCVKRSHYPW